MTVGQAIRAVRKRKGFNQGDFSKKIGLSRPSFCMIELDRMGASSKTFQKICKGLGIPKIVISIMTMKPDDLRKLANIIADPAYPEMQVFIGGLVKNLQDARKKDH